MPRPGFYKKAFFFILLFASLLLIGSANGAEAKTKKRIKRASVNKSRVLPVSSGDIYADLVIESGTGHILHAVNATSLRHPASLTKMMTLYLTFQALEAGKLSPQQRLPVSTHAAAQSPSKLGLRPGQSIRVEDAVMGLVTKSANDASVVLAEALGESEYRFAQMMTRQAKALGMSRTVFKNASGLPDPEQVTTARDMAILGHALVHHYPRYYDVFSRERFSYGGQTHNNHNHLMSRYEGMDGIKTGYVRASGFNLVASAVRGRTRLIGVVLGGRSRLGRDNQMAQLLDKGFADAGRLGIRGVMAAANEAQGDGGDGAEPLILALPAKTAAIFPGPATEPPQGTASGKPGEPPASWGIQVGAYGDAAAGQTMLSSLGRDFESLLGRTKAVLLKEPTESGAIYRARFMGMEPGAARSLCAYLVKRGQGCYVVAPESVDG